MTRNYHTIGDVLAILQEDFPDISISKIRFLESQGLITPDRTDSGYRKFDQSDIDRLRFILREQRDRFLPLKVIKHRLEDWERGTLDVDEEQDPTRPDLAADVDLVPSGVQLDRDALVSASGLPEAQVRQLESFGLVQARLEGGREMYDEHALHVAKIAREFLRFGLEPRHLKPYRIAVDREVGLFDQVLAPMRAQRTSVGDAEAMKALAELELLSGKLHRALLGQALEGVLAESGGAPAGSGTGRGS